MRAYRLAPPSRAESFAIAATSASVWTGKSSRKLLGRGAESTLGLGTVSRDRREFSETADSSLVKLATTGTSLP
jgi:hypothetical protein